MAYTQSHLDALQEALASGTLTVTFEGRSMTYGAVQELQRRSTSSPVSAFVSTNCRGARASN